MSTLWALVVCIGPPMGPTEHRRNSTQHGSSDPFSSDKEQQLEKVWGPRHGWNPRWRRDESSLEPKRILGDQQPTGVLFSLATKWRCPKCPLLRQTKDIVLIVL